MLRLEVVKSPDEDSVPQHSGNMNYGIAITRRLVDLWVNTNRIVCADSYFVSAETVQGLADFGIRFMGVVKTATRDYPMAYLSSKPIAKRGDHYSMLYKNENGGNVYWFHYGLAEKGVISYQQQALQIPDKRYVASVGDKSGT